MRDVAEIFSDISAHQIKGLMVHSQLSDYYRFLGLNCYADCHKERFESESKGWRKLADYYIEHFNKLIVEKAIDDPAVIPADWFKVSRLDVDTSTKRRAVERGMQTWVEW